MADLDYDGFGPGEADDVYYPARASRVGRVVNLLGAVMSLALVVGVAVWGYKLLVRDVTGIPVVQAMAGPMRVQPDDPGGDRAAHQGLAVNRIAALGEAAPPPDEIVLAPRSADLEAEDMAQGALRTQPQIQPAVLREAPETPVEAAVLEATTQVMTAEVDLAEEPTIEVIPASVPGPSRSLRPRLRPASFVTRVAAPAPAAAPADVAEVDVTTLPAGTRLVQFGAYDNAADARAAWGRLADQFGGLLQDKERVIEEATTGGRVFFRLRAMGFADLADARRFCAAFVAENADCIPVVTR